MKLTLYIFFLFLLTASAHAQVPGAERVGEYMRLLRGKRVALVVNQTSWAGDMSLPDKLLERGVGVKKIFVPEHGFRGVADAGAHLDNTVDSATGLLVISLYGKHMKPTADDMAGIDVVVYDLQDVGVRFYTYISTLQYCMEACAEHGAKLVVLDRPDPNGFYVDGPVLEEENRSFVGMQRIPIVYGMTAGEYAMMLKGEGWVKNANKLKMEVVTCSGYDHTMKYRLPVWPSPNLRMMEAIYVYPSLCLFEGTPVSVGRGTDMPFMQWGCPELEGKFAHSFRPMSGPGAKTPPYEGRQCYGMAVSVPVLQDIWPPAGNYRMYLGWLLAAYKAYPDKEKFFTPFFTKLAGTAKLAEQIKKGMTEEEIRASWQPGIDAFKKVRSRYLLYPDKARRAKNKWE